MIVKPKIINNICLNSHPAGCAADVERQINYVRSKGPIEGPKNVLVIGSSTGYGLATRIEAAFGAGATGVVLPALPSNPAFCRAVIASLALNAPVIVKVVPLGAGLLSA